MHRRSRVSSGGNRHVHAKDLSRLDTLPDFRREGIGEALPLESDLEIDFHPGIVDERVVSAGHVRLGWVPVDPESRAESHLQQKATRPQEIAFHDEQVEIEEPAERHAAIRRFGEHRALHGDNPEVRRAAGAQDPAELARQNEVDHGDGAAPGLERRQEVARHQVRAVLAQAAAHERGHAMLRRQTRQQRPVRHLGRQRPERGARRRVHMGARARQ
jgi:hypothetical protein